jgi:hypothetical protein
MEGMTNIMGVLQDEDNIIEPVPTTRHGGIIVSGSDWSMKRVMKSMLRTTGLSEGEHATLSTVLEWIGAVPGSKNNLINRVSIVNWSAGCSSHKKA